MIFSAGLKKASNYIGELIYPKLCLHCGAEGEHDMDLCLRCYENLSWIKFACQRCALQLKNDNAKICGACSKRKLSFEQAIAPFLFEGFIREAIYKFKFNQKLNLGKLLAQLLLRHIDTKDVEIPDVIVPVPLHKNRLRKRGYNQALEIARIITKKLDCELSYKSVFRNRDTSTQMELPAKHRHKNVMGAFSIKKEACELNNKHVCIIDDVMTTGNTVNEVAKCLRNAGAKRVDVWCVARVA
ncbi:MAG: ComF family protein [Pseudomonadota bacterium]